jgi:hypothetical protein
MIRWKFGNSQHYGCFMSGVLSTKPKSAASAKFQRQISGLAPQGGLGNKPSPALAAPAAMRSSAASISWQDF